MIPLFQLGVLACQKKSLQPPTKINSRPMKITLSGEEAQRLEENEKQEADLSSAGSADGAERRHGERKSGAKTRRSELRSGTTAQRHRIADIPASPLRRTTTTPPRPVPQTPTSTRVRVPVCSPPPWADVSGGARPAQRHSPRR